jgi:hypothetical protein
MLDVYAELGRISNPVTLLSKALGAPMLVFRASAAFTQRLNIDSRVKAFPTSPTSCLVQHTVLGDMESIYPSQIFGTVGYYNGMKFALPLKDFNSRIRLAQIPLTKLLEGYSFLGIHWSLDKNGNLLDEKGDILAESVRFADTPFITLKPKEDYPYPIFRLTRNLELEGLLLQEGKCIIGDPALFGINTPRDAFEEIPLEEVKLLRGLRDFAVGGIQVIDRDVFYGGEHPAPTSIYEFSWRAPGVRYLFWSRIGQLISSMHSSPRLVQRMARERDDAEQKRIETEQRLERIVADLASRTSREAELSQREEDIKEGVRANYHDIAHRYTAFRRSSYVGAVNFIGAILSSMSENERNSFLKKIQNEDLDLPEIQSVANLLDLATRRINCEEGPLNFPQINSIIGEFKEFIKGSPMQTNADNYLSWWGGFKSNCGEYEQEVREWMTLMDADSLTKVNYRDLWNDILHKQRDAIEGIRYNLQVPSINISCNPRKIALVAENLLLNMIESARKVFHPAISFFSEVTDTNLETVLQNPAVWESLAQAQMVEEKANGSSTDRFSTKEDSTNKNLRGGGLSYIKREIRSLGGSYHVTCDYNKGLFIQRILFPKEIII